MLTSFFLVYIYILSQSCMYWFTEYHVYAVICKCCLFIFCEVCVQEHFWFICCLDYLLNYLLILMLSLQSLNEFMLTTGEILNCFDEQITLWVWWVNLLDFYSISFNSVPCPSWWGDSRRWARENCAKDSRCLFVIPLQIKGAKDFNSWVFISVKIRIKYIWCK